MHAKVRVQTTINGEPQEFLCEPRQSLLECLRDIVGLTGTKEGCNDGNCGACTVILDGRIVTSCLVLGVEAEGAASPPSKASPGAASCIRCSRPFWRMPRCSAASARPASSWRPRRCSIRNRTRARSRSGCGWRIISAAAPAMTRSCARCSRPPRNAGGESMRTQEYTVVGTRPIRHDGADKVTGRALYGADFQMAGLLHGYILRSPHAHARIRRIDTSKAAALPGVKAVVTAADFPQSARPHRRSGRRRDAAQLHRAATCWRAARCSTGDTPSPPSPPPALHVAEEAAGLIEVEYEVLPCVLNAPEAMQEGAPILHDDLKTKEFGEQTGRVSNVAEHFRSRAGRCRKGLRRSRRHRRARVQHRHRAPGLHRAAQRHRAVERRRPRPDLVQHAGRRSWCATSPPACSTCRSRASRVTPMEIGGGFGGKIPVYLEPVAALLSKKTGQPVKIVMSRKDVFEGTGPTPGSYIRVKIGARKDGHITAAQGVPGLRSGRLSRARWWCPAPCASSPPTTSPTW